jgi:hypothetical protein
VKLWIVGNSHTWALRRAHRELGQSFQSRFDEVTICQVAAARTELEPFSAPGDGAVELTDTGLRRKLRHRGGVNRIAGDDVWAISMGLHNILLVRNSYWDTHEPIGVAQPPAIPVSRGQIEEMVEVLQQPSRQFMLQLKDAGIKAFMVASPPLRRDHPVIASRRPEPSAELDRIARQSMRRFLEVNDIGIVESPAESLDADGLLQQRFEKRDNRGAGVDVTHADIEYGHLMLRDVVDYAERRWLQA